MIRSKEYDGPIWMYFGLENKPMMTNLSRLRRDYINSTTMFNMGDRVLPYLPSYAVQDRAGIAPACMTLSASTRPGDYCTNVQPETARKT